MNASEEWEYFRNRFSCIPLVNLKKETREDRWQRFSEYRNDIGPWQSFTGLGVVCGRASGVMILDIDDPDIFLDRIERLRKPWDLTNEFVVETASGKFHIYKNFSPELHAELGVARYAQLKDSWGLEILLSRAYAVAPPTAVRKDQIDGKYTLLYDNPINDWIPDELLEDLIRSRTMQRRDQEAKRAMWAKMPKIFSTMPVIFERIGAKERLAIEGQRHDELLKIIGACARGVEDFDEHDEELFDLIRDATSASMSDQEIRNTIDSVFDYVRKNP